MLEPEEPFRLRVYGKSELARLYFPNSRPATAMRDKPLSQHRAGAERTEPRQAPQVLP